MNQAEFRVLGPLSPGSPSRAQLGLAVEPDGSALPVVLIFAPEEVTSDPEAIAALERETARATQLEHPHISRVHALARLEQGLARVTEYADGETLRTVLDRGGRIPFPIAARLVADMAQGVHYAHLAGNDDGSPLVHGDLRPETVMIAFSGTCKVTGYGALSVAPRERDGRRVVNRRLYCAPEQVVGGRESVIVGTDVFLLGLILHECLSGSRPFSDASDLDQAVLMGALAPLPEEVPASFAPVIERCTAKKAAGRFPNALAVREAIVEALGGIPLPSDVEVADWLQPLCPPTEIGRAARQQTIDQGIATYAREHWAAKRAAPAPVPKPKPRASPAPAAIPLASPPEPLAAATVARSSEGGFWTRGRIVGVAALLLISAVAFVGLRHAPAAPGGGPASTSGASADAPATPVTPPPAAQVSAPTAPPAPLTGDLIDDAPAAEGQPSAPETGDPTAELLAAGATASASSTEGTLRIDTEPRSTISSRGRQLGRTPLTVRLEAGRHTLQISNKDSGLDVTRVLTIRAGQTTEQMLVFSRGYLTVNAPAEAQVLLDGRALGKGSQREVGVYEGDHTLTVVANGQRWEERFNVRANQRVNFDVGVVE